MKAARARRSGVMQMGLVISVGARALYTAEAISEVRSVGADSQHGRTVWPAKSCARAYLLVSVSRLPRYTRGRQEFRRDFPVPRVCELKTSKWKAEEH